MVAIRLSRVGKKNKATFRIIVSDKRQDTHGTALEILGSYNPHTSPATIELDVERAKYWLSVGAQPSDTVYNLFVEKGIITGQKRIVAKAKAAPAETTEAAAAETAEKAEKPAEAPAA